MQTDTNLAMPTHLCSLLQSKSPAAVQPHLGKCFDGIRRLEFGGEDPKAPDILAMVSAEGEKVPLGKNLKVLLMKPGASDQLDAADPIVCTALCNVSLAHLYP